MTYATTYHIGYEMPTQRAKAKTVAPPVERVRKLDATTERRKRNQKDKQKSVPVTMLPMVF